MEEKMKPLTLTAKDVMKREVLTVPSDLPVNRVAEFLVERGVSGAPVLSEKSQPIGAVSLTDIARHVSHPTSDPRTHHQRFSHLSPLMEHYAEAEIRLLRLKIDEAITARDIMTPILFDVHEDTPIQQVADIMIRGHIRRVFVTRNKTVVGVISAQDLLTLIRDGDI